MTRPEPAASANLTRRQFIIGASTLAGATALAGTAAIVVAGCGGASPSTGPSATPSQWIRIPTDSLVAGEPRWVTFDSTPGASAAPLVAGPGATAGATAGAVASAGPGATAGAVASAGPGATAGAVAGAWLVLQADGSVVAFTPACTHQRCLYDWDKATTRFVCRCHRGFFSVDGKVLEGPPPRPLGRYQVRPDEPGAIDIGWVDGP